MRLLELLSMYKLPQIKEMGLIKVPENNEVVKKFIQNSLPPTLKFHFNCMEPVYQPADIYLESLCSAAASLTGEGSLFILYYLSISSFQLVRLLGAAKHIREVGFAFCTLETEEDINFGYALSGAAFRVLNLDYSGLKNYSSWGEHPERLQKLLDGLCTLSHPAKTLSKTV